jgi:hypothetical protein
MLRAARDVAKTVKKPKWLTLPRHCLFYDSHQHDSEQAYMIPILQYVILLSPDKLEVKAYVASLTVLLQKTLRCTGSAINV